MNCIENTKTKASKEDIEKNREDDTLRRCFAHCVNNFHVNNFVNEEEQCIKNCAKKQHSYFTHLENSISLMENPLYLKFY